MPVVLLNRADSNKVVVELDRILAAPTERRSELQQRFLDAIRGCEIVETDLPTSAEDLAWLAKFCKGLGLGEPEPATELELLEIRAIAIGKARAGERLS